MLSAEEVVLAYFERFGAGDAAGIAELFPPDAACMPNGRETIRGRDAVRAFFETVAAAASVRFDEVVIDRCVELGDAAVVEIRTSETITVYEPARTVVEDFRELFALRRLDDRWVIDSYMGNQLRR